MAGVDSGVDNGVECGWVDAGTKKGEVWPVTVINTDPKTGNHTIKWAPDPNKPHLGAFIVRPGELKKWNDVKAVILTKVARDAYDFLLKTHHTIVNVLEGQKRVHHTTVFLDRSPSEKKARKNPGPTKSAPTKSAPAKPSPAKPSKKVKYPSRSSFCPLILLAADKSEAGIIG